MALWDTLAKAKQQRDDAVDRNPHCQHRQMLRTGEHGQSARSVRRIGRHVAERCEQRQQQRRRVRTAESGVRIRARHLHVADALPHGGERHQRVGELAARRQRRVQIARVQNSGQQQAKRHAQRDDQAPAVTAEQWQGNGVSVVDRDRMLFSASACVLMSRRTRK